MTMTATMTAKLTQRASVLQFAALGLSLLLCQSGLAQTTETGDAGGTTSGFEAAEPDLSVFDGIDRTETNTFGTETSTAGGGGGGGGGFGGGGGGLGGFFGGLSQAFGGGNNGGSTQPVIRVRLRSAIEVAPRSPVLVQQSATKTLTAAPPRSGVQGVAVSMNGRTAVLSGVVKTEKDRRMSELLMRLQPGVRAVDNRVVVSQ